MPEFANINSVYSAQKKLTKNELLRAVKFAIASEYEAIQVYQQIMENTDNKSAQIILADIAHDEMHHAGQLLKLLYLLSPADVAEYEYGTKEALELLGLKSKKAKKAKSKSKK